MYQKFRRWWRMPCSELIIRLDFISSKAVSFSIRSDLLLFWVAIYINRYQHFQMQLSQSMAHTKMVCFSDTGIPQFWNIRPLFNLFCCSIITSDMNLSPWTRTDVNAIKAEIFARGPVKASINGTAIKNYKGGIISNPALENIGTSHGVSIVGWGHNITTDKQHWIVRNSWGQYWGEMSMFRVEIGKNLLGIESNVVWATPGHFSISNRQCSEDGSNCDKEDVIHYVDPSNSREAVKRRLYSSLYWTELDLK